MSNANIKSKAVNLQEFIKRANLVHSNYYSYYDEDFLTRYSVVKVKCPVHGDFNVHAIKHLKGHGCKLCGHEGFKGAKGRFVGCSRDGLATLYVTLCSSASEVFYKVGVTTQKKVATRLAGIKGYKYEVLYEITDTADAIYDLEQILLHALTERRYEPKNNFGGHTECFSTIEPILFLLENIKIA